MPDTAEDCCCYGDSSTRTAQPSPTPACTACWDTQDSHKPGWCQCASNPALAWLWKTAVLVCWCAESLELRILEALTAAYPKPLNGAQLAKLCGHFKLKSKVT